MPEGAFPQLRLGNVDRPGAPSTKKCIKPDHRSFILHSNDDLTISVGAGRDGRFDERQDALILLGILCRAGGQYLLVSLPRHQHTRDRVVTCCSPITSFGTSMRLACWVSVSFWLLASGYKSHSMNCPALCACYNGLGLFWSCLASCSTWCAGWHFLTTELLFWVLCLAPVSRCARFCCTLFQAPVLTVRRY
jgi:hypothetical protein